MQSNDLGYYPEAFALGSHRMQSGLLFGEVHGTPRVRTLIFPFAPLLPNIETITSYIIKG